LRDHEKRFASAKNIYHPTNHSVKGQSAIYGKFASNLHDRR